MLLLVVKDGEAMPSIPKKDLPRYVRQCWEEARKANRKNRDAEVERLRFYVGGELQWRQEEVTKRTNSQRPIVTINQCKPAVDQIEGDIRLNPPGPQVHPVGGGADGDTADIIEGLIREVEYRSGAKVAYSTAGKYSAAGGYAVIELATEHVDDRSFAQQLRIDSVEDPATVFFDPNSRMANRQDAGWAGKLKAYSKSQYISAFGKDRRILQPKMLQQARGWIADALGYDGRMTQLDEWTGLGNGPYYVCEFYMVDIERRTLRLYSDQIERYDDESVPSGVNPIVDPEDKNRYTRVVPVRKVTKHVVDAFEELRPETQWLGKIIPLFPVLGPEVYIDGVLHRLSLISGAMDAQRALNYVATTATELAGLMPKSPFIGPKGSFDDPKWLAANSETWAFLEYTPVYVTDETTGAQTLAPPPQRNHWEAPIQWLLQLGQYFSQAIQSVTGIYDPSLGKNKGDQSGKAIEQLRSESNVGNFSYADNLHRAIEVMYNEMCVIFPQIMDGPRVVTIVRPDSQHEVKEINRLFPANGIDPATGKKGKANNIALGSYAARVIAGKNFDTRQQEAIVQIGEFFASSPQALGIPGVAAKYLRMIGSGNPQVEGMADLIDPPNQGDATSPEEMAQQLQQAQQQVQALTQLVQQMKQAIDAKLPQVEADKFKTLIDSLTKIRVAEINASKATMTAAADNEARQLEQQLGLAHETATAAEGREHEENQARLDREHQQQTQTREHMHGDASQDKDLSHQTAMAEMTSKEPAGKE